MENFKGRSLAVIYGSDSSERGTAGRSGLFRASRIDGRRVDVYESFARFGDWKVVAVRPLGGKRVEL